MLKAPRLPTRQTDIDGRHLCCVRITLVMIACLILLAGSLLTTLMVDNRLVMPMWVWSSPAVSLFTGVMLLVLVLATCRGLGCRPVLVLAAVDVLLCCGAFTCNLLGILKHKDVSKISLQKTNWVWNDTFSDCRLSDAWLEDACECVHVAEHQRVELELCQFYDDHVAISAELFWLKIAYCTMAGLSLAAAFITGHVMLHACFRPRLRRLTSSPNNYTAPTIYAPSTLERADSGAYEHIDSLISSSYMDPIRLPVLHELSSFISKRQQSPLTEEPELEERETSLDERRHMTLHAQSEYDSVPSESDSDMFRTV